MIQLSSKKMRKVSNKKPNLGSLKELEKEEQIKPKVRRRKEIIKVREEINKMEIKKIEKSVKPIVGSLKG